MYNKKKVMYTTPQRCFGQYAPQWALIPCFVASNMHQTLLNGIGSRQDAVAGTCPDTENCSRRLFEVSPWMWRHGMGQSRKVSVAEAETRRQVTGTADSANQQAAKTLKWRREERGHEFYKCQHGRQAEEADGQ